MSSIQKLHFSVDIAVPPARVYERMIDDAGYRDWTAAFCEGSYYEGSWQQGARIRFLSPSGEGMVAEIAENRPGEFISIRHLGQVANGVEDTTSDTVRAWAGALENYTFTSIPGGTRLTVDQDMTEDFTQQMKEVWPKALARLKALCEAR